MLSKQFVILGVVMSLAGLGSGADASFDNNPMGVNVAEVDFYVYEGEVEESITSDGQAYFLVNFSQWSGLLYWIEVDGVPVDQDDYRPVDTDIYGNGSFTLKVSSVSESVSNAFMAFLACDVNHNHTFDGNDTAEHLVVGYLY